MQQRAASSLWISCLVLFIFFLFLLFFNFAWQSNLFAHFCGNFNFLKPFNSISFPILFNKFFFPLSQLFLILHFDALFFFFFNIFALILFIFLKLQGKKRKLDNWRVNTGTRWRRKIMKIILTAFLRCLTTVVIAVGKSISPTFQPRLRLRPVSG